MESVKGIQFLRVFCVTFFVADLPCVVIFIFFLFSDAHALPQFTRQYELKCSKCHFAPPTLNFTGRRFLQNGYRFFMEERDNRAVKDSIKLDRTIPLGAWLSSQLYENKPKEPDRIRPFHEARLYIGGGIYRDLSAFMRWDLEQENGYKFVSRIATLSYNPTPLINTHVSWTSVTFHDINDTLHSSRQLTLKPNSVISQPFGLADNDGTLASPRQGIHVSGWVSDHVFYILGSSGDADDTDIGKLSTLFGRLTMEILPVSGYDSFAISIGGFGLHGFSKNSNSREFDRLIGDLQMDIPFIYFPVPSVVRLMGAYLWAKDDLQQGGFAHNRAWYAQATFASMRKGSPKWVPIVRFDEYTKNNGQDAFRELTLNLTYYFVENFRAQVEHWVQVDVPPGSDKDSSVIFRLVFLY